MSVRPDIPVAFSTGSLYTFGLERVFAWTSEAGFDGVEVMMDDRWDTHQPEYVGDLARRYSLPVLAVHPPIYSGVWRLSKDETLVRSAKLAVALGAPVLVAHPPRPARLAAWESGPLAEARRMGVAVAVENMPRSGRARSGRRGRRSASLLRLGGERSSYLPEHLARFEAVTLDTSHVAASGLDVMDFYRKVGPSLRHVHLSDSDGSGGDQHRVPGRGNLPLRGLLAALAADGYAGAVSLELKPFQTGAPHPESVLERMRESLLYVRRGLGQG